MKVIIASDHAGFELKKQLLKAYPHWEDLGPETDSRVDYPDFANKLTTHIDNSSNPTYGVLVCGSGQGMAMAANKSKNIRAALCWSVETAELARQHNDANVLCLGSRLLPAGTIFEIIDTFFKTEFEGGRHADRVNKMTSLLPN